MATDKVCEICQGVYVSKRWNERWCSQCKSEGKRQSASRYEKKRHAKNPGFRHRIGADAYWKMHAQGCASCHIAFGAFGTRAAATVDHDHACCPGTYSCGKCVRGLLCYLCNTIAAFIESSRWELVMKYLERNRRNEIDNL